MRGVSGKPNGQSGCSAAGKSTLLPTMKLELGVLERLDSSGRHAAGAMLVDGRVILLLGWIGLEVFRGWFPSFLRVQPLNLDDPRSLQCAPLAKS